MRRLAAIVAALILGTLVLAAPAAAATPQTITFTLQTAGTLDDSFALTATADSGLPVSYATSTPATCSLSGDTLALDALGTCTVTASQAGDSTYDPAPDVTHSIEILPASNAPQTIDFDPPSSGVVGGSVDLAATASASSGLEVTFASATPATCSVSGTVAKLEILGTCGVVASQPGNDIWLPAPDVRKDITIELSPVSSAFNLGRLALNGPVISSVLDPDTGTTYIVGPFDQMGIRTGPLAVLESPASGDDDVLPETPDVIGNQLAVLPDDDTGYFLVGDVNSINGDGTSHPGITRMTAAGAIDKTWAVDDACVTGAVPTWSAGDWLVAAHEASPDGKGYTTMGLQLFDKATGRAHATGAGTWNCGTNVRRWSSIGPMPQLAACKTWVVCIGVATNLAYDPSNGVMVVDMLVVAGQSAAAPLSNHVLVAYDTVAGTRLWTRSLAQPSANQHGQTTGLVAFGGAVLATGDLQIDGLAGPGATMVLLDGQTGTVLQRWARDGERSLDDPTTVIAPPTTCTPTMDGQFDSLAPAFTALDPSHVVGFGLNGNSAAVIDVGVCEYGLTGTGLDARLATTELGGLSAHTDRQQHGVLPNALVGGRYLVGGFDAFDLQSGEQVADWHPDPSIGAGLSTVALADRVVLGGPFTFFHGAPVDYALALDKDLNPIDGFDAQIEGYNGGAPWMRSVTLAGGRLIVAGIIGQSGQHGPVVALDLETGQRVWGETTDYIADPFSVTPSPDGTGFYVGGDWLDGTGGTPLIRYVPSGGGFVRDPGWHPAFGQLGPNAPAVTGVKTIDDRIYVGGNFASIDGHARQGLARLTADGSLDPWAPKLVDELKIPATATPELYARAFLEVGSKVVVAGTFHWIFPSGESPAASMVFAYDSTTGKRVMPVGTNAPWFPVGYDWGSYDLDQLGDTIYVAMGNSGVGAFDASTLAYLPQRSIRTAIPTDSIVYAIEVRESASLKIASLADAGGAGMHTSAAAPPPDALVVGGSIASFDDRSAGNVIEVGVDLTKPLVIARAPAKASTGVARNTNVLVTFSEPVTGSTSGVYLVDTKTVKRVPGKVTYDAALRRLSINPDSLLVAGRTYKVKVLSSVKDKAGNSIAGVWWTFRVSTDATRPKIVKRSPSSGATGVSRTANVVVTFSEIVKVSSTKIRLKDASTGNYVSATVTLSSDGKAATLNPTSSLKSSHRYTVVVKGVTDRAGNSVTTSSWTFKTRS